jgi:long-subunit fatty acid transport protein
MKAVFSAALVLGKAAILSADYEYVDYSTIKLGDGGDGHDFFDENKDIKEAYKSVGNIRLGAEYRLTKDFSLRGGYEYYPSPYREMAFDTTQPNSRIDNSVMSAGLGYRQGGFFFDLAYKHVMDESYSELYSGSDMVNYDIANDQLIMTLGFRF